MWHVRSATSLCAITSCTIYSRNRPHPHYFAANKDDEVYANRDVDHRNREWLAAERANEQPERWTPRRQTPAWFTRLDRLGATERGLFNMNALDECWNEHQLSQHNHSHLFWVLLNLSLWGRLLSKGPHPESSDTRIPRGKNTTFASP
jgi:hypothetical protein